MELEKCDKGPKEEEAERKRKGKRMWKIFNLSGNGGEKRCWK